MLRSSTDQRPAGAARGFSAQRLAPTVALGFVIWGAKRQGGSCQSTAAAGFTLIPPLCNTRPVVAVGASRNLQAPRAGLLQQLCYRRTRASYAKRTRRSNRATTLSRILSLCTINFNRLLEL